MGFAKIPNYEAEMWSLLSLVRPPVEVTFKMKGVGDRTQHDLWELKVRFRGTGNTKVGCEAYGDTRERACQVVVRHMVKEGYVL